MNDMHPSRDGFEITSVDVAVHTSVAHEFEQSIVVGTLDGWSHLANCKGYSKLFFGKRAERPQARARREGKAHVLCAECAVQSRCRTFARNNHEFGYWGGENEESRRDAGFIPSSPTGVRVAPIINY